ncbi:MAG: ribosome assembly cofactor RimP [Sphaerochaetaceae bacterium]
MLQDSITKDKLFIDASEVLSPLDLQVVDVRKSEYGATLGISVIIRAQSHEVTVADCAKAYRILFPRWSLEETKRDLELEVSTPGIQRTLRDYYEFSLFVGRRCRVYDSAKSAWVEGIIKADSERCVTLSKAHIDDSKDLIEEYVIPYEQIQKAKLAYAWEDVL